MKDVAKTVKRQINEAGVLPLGSVSDGMNVSFRQLYKVMNKYSYSDTMYEGRGIYVKSSDEDIQFAAMSVILKALKYFRG